MVAVYSVLVVDDDPDIRVGICEILTEEGYRCSQASDGNMALRQLDQRPADVVVIDMLMPERDGVETIQAIKNRWPQTRIIAMSGGGSAMGSDYLLQIGSGVGAQVTIEKPFHTAAFVELVAKILREDDLA